MQVNGVVSHLYPSSHALIDYLKQLLPSDGSLLLAEDSTDFKDLLQSTRIVGDPSAVDIDAVNLNGKARVRDVINRVIPVLLRSKESNCLAFGYKQKSQQSEGILRNNMNTECYFANTIQTLFLTSSWQTLLDRIGENIFRHLLCRKMFLKLKHGSYLQISGPITIDPAKPLDSTPNSSLSLKGSSVIHRYRMLYNTRREGRPGLPKSFCFLKMVPHQIITEIFNEKLATIPSSISSLLIPLIERLQMKYFEYDIPSAMKRFLIACAGQDPDRIRAKSQTKLTSSRKRGCRGGQHVQAKKKQRVSQSETDLTSIRKGNYRHLEHAPPSSSIAPQGPLVSLGDFLIDELCARQQVAQSFSLCSQPQTQNSSDVVRSGKEPVSSRSHRRRMKRKMKALLSKTPSVPDTIDVTPQTSQPVIPSEGLHLHTARSQLTFVSVVCNKRYSSNLDSI